MSEQLDVRTRGSGVRFAVRVQPRASRAEVAGVHGTALKVRLTAAPIAGAANEALIALLADVLQVTPRSIRIVAGATARTKMIDVDGVDRARAPAGEPSGTVIDS